jgi:hypothetical protein
MERVSAMRAACTDEVLALRAHVVEGLRARAAAIRADPAQCRRDDEDAHADYLVDAIRRRITASHLLSALAVGTQTAVLGEPIVLPRREDHGPVGEPEETCAAYATHLVADLLADWNDNGQLRFFFSSGCESGFQRRAPCDPPCADRWSGADADAPCRCALYLNVQLWRDEDVGGPLPTLRQVERQREADASAAVAAATAAAVAQERAAAAADKAAMGSRLSAMFGGDSDE